MAEPSSVTFRRRGTTHVQVITDAPVPRSAELARRQRNYLISMSIRVACFIAMAFVHGWLRWACLAGAAIIPWFAVIFANVSSKGPAVQSTPADEAPEQGRPMLTNHEVIPGEWHQG